MTDTLTSTQPLDVTAFVAAIVEGNADVERVETSAKRHSADTETLVINVAGQHVQFTSEDLLNDLDEIRSFFVGLDVSIIEARQEAIEAERHACPGCSVMLDPDEEVCGAGPCIAYVRAERRYEAAL